MSYATYTTEAIVCGSKDSYTSDRSYLFFTKDAGMLWATARSVREERSKQRFALQDFSIIRVSLVKGKGGWRIGSVEAVSNPFMEASERSSRAGISAVLKLLRRFLHGEVAHPDLYRDAVLALSCLVAADPTDVVDIQNQFTLRLLHQLGYIAPKASFTHILEAADPWSVPEPIPVEAERAISEALIASHL
ncbi:recombination protein O N-terminal domain-containing protein [Candidatus Pacebacteria bacterium]|nr:recombination protein O N-terminal domain-containing protein [Candidatus Paceibacterota bacterium]